MGEVATVVHVFVEVSVENLDKKADCLFVLPIRLNQFSSKKFTWISRRIDENWRVKKANSKKKKRWVMLERPTHVLVHSGALWKVVDHALHEFLEAGVGEAFC